MKFRPKHKITVFDKIFGILLIAALVIAIILNKPVIIAWAIIISILIINIRDYVRRKTNNMR